MDEPDSDALRQALVQSYNKKDWFKCLEICKELHKRLPENQPISLKLADVYARVGQRDKAVEIYRNVAESYAGKRDLLRAIGVLKVALELAPDRDDIRERLERLCVIEKGGEERGDALPDIPLLSELNEEELVEVVKSFRHISFPMGGMICREGDEGDSFFIINRGCVKVFIEGVAGEKMEIARLKEGDFFGEVGFFTDAKRHASVMALDDTDLLEIGKGDFEEIEEGHPRIREILEDFYRKRVLDKLMAVSPLFGMLKEGDRHELLGRFVHKTFKQGETVVNEGEEGKSLFIIKSGRVGVSTVEPGGKEISLAQLRENDFFGEGAVITGKPRTATVTALTLLEVMELSKEDLMACFQKYPKMEEMLKRYLKARAEKTVSRIMAMKRINVKEGLV